MERPEDREIGRIMATESVDLCGEIALIPADDKTALREFATAIHQIGQRLVESRELAFIGYVYYALKKKILIGDERFKITVRKEDGTERDEINVVAFTDGASVSYTALKFHDKSLLYPTMTTIALHELIHVISFHAGIKGRRLAKTKRLKENEFFFRIIWTMAEEHTVNSVIEHLPDRHERGALRIRKGIGIYFDDVFDAIPYAPVEKVYEYMKRERGFNFEPKATSDGGEKKEYESDKYELTVEGDPMSGGYKMTLKDKATGKQQVYYGDGTGRDGTNMDEETLKNMKNQVEMLRNQWTGSFGSQQKGNMPDGLAIYLDNIYSRPLPWDRLYKNAVYHLAAQSEDETTYTRPHDIFSEEIPEIPGFLEEERLRYLIAGIDTSGSQDDDILKVVIGTLLDVTTYFDRVIVYYHDVDVHKSVYLDATEHTEATILEELRELRGRGGTSHKPIFELIQKLSENEDPSMDVEISGIIFYTDFISDVSGCIDGYRILKDVPVIWVIDDLGNHGEAHGSLPDNHNVIVVNRQGDLLDMYA